MRILTFDTSGDKMYVTMGNDGQVDISRIIENTAQRYHSASLIPIIAELLREKNITMQDINAVGVNIGPGSFTGIRASATVARIMAQNLNIPVIGISSLEIFSLINNTDKNSLCLLDARKGKAYTGVYTPEADVIKEPTALEYNDIIDFAKNNDFFIIADKIMSEKLKAEGLECVNLQETDYDFGINLAKLTYKHLKTDDREQFKWFNLKPLYIQPPPITMPKNTK
ncbi:MAG: tRNA (adenosine(37)-N6)-threonylcarbamoyltransferase complex dimerization subunit type 1 TsaB [Candidatus Melainabacteria bacterium GWF2_32_7]|nr:MAG: tRNA (adenosine(37)-N6)-threonylcarbamoyltransferase complex dimerization subunit type 1 TsaB [Candidatus Melainabacteria bacterium GWF2_32_7]